MLAQQLLQPLAGRAVALRSQPQLGTAVEQALGGVAQGVEILAQPRGGVAAGSVAASARAGGRRTPLGRRQHAGEVAADL